MYYIYRITNNVNGKTYIGQHKYKELDDDYMGSGILLAQAKKKYRIENFEKEILYSSIQYKETADDVEKFAITKERALGKAQYNIADGGHSGGNKGKHFSEEHKRKLSEAHKGKKLPPRSEEYRQKMSEAMKGKHKGRPSPNKGNHHSEETKQKISAASRGRHSNKGQHWKLVDGKRVYYQSIKQ